MNAHDDTNPPNASSLEPDILAADQQFQNFSVPPLELNTSFTGQDESLDYKTLESDRLDVYLEPSFTHSDSSSDVERLRQPERKDSFYESDEDVRTPKKSPRMRKAVLETDVETPPTYEHAITPDSIEMTMATPAFSSPSHLPSDSVKPERDPKYENLIGEPVASDASLLVSTSPTSLTAEPHHQHPHPHQHHHQQTEPTLESEPVVVTSSALPLPSYTEAINSMEEYTTPEVTPRGESPAAPSPEDGQSSSAPLAKLESTDSDSDQVNSYSPFSFKKRRV